MFGTNLTLSYYPSSIGVSNEGENKVALEGKEMAKAITAKTTGSKLVTKVTKKFVATLNEFVEVRSLYNLYEKMVADGRSAILAEVGKEEQVLIHNGVEVAIIAKVDKERVNLDTLKEKFPEAYQACLEVKPEYHIRKATPRQ